MYRWYQQFHAGRVGIALLLLRLIVGLAFVLHGWPKLQNVGGFAAKAHLPEALAGAVAGIEVFGGILLMLGLLTPIAAASIAVVMLGALLKVHLPAGDPFVGPGGKSYELAAIYLFAMISFLLTGPGIYSVDARLVRQMEHSRSAAPGSRRRGWI